MTGAGSPGPVVACEAVSKRFEGKHQSFQALESVSFEAAPGQVTALVGSDGAGKTTLMRLIAGLLPLDAGRISVLGCDVASGAAEVQARLGYMPQRFGLYEDLTVNENLDLYADLHGITGDERAAKYPELMEMTRLGPFGKRLAGQLSGGMKQKLGLACTLISKPELLLLDEPTAGVDPLSRRELWRIIRGLVRDEGLPVVISTSYLDEADRCDQVIVLHAGKVLAKGPPAEVSAVAKERTFLLRPDPDQRPRDLQAHLLANPAVVDAAPEAGLVRIVLKAPDPAPIIDGIKAEALSPTQAHFEDGFMTLVRRAVSGGAMAESDDGVTRSPGSASGTAVRVRDLVRRFGDFTAVDKISFEVAHGEIFGLLGPNGAGKTTTFRMLCGLLAPTGGELAVGEADMRRARASARSRLGYVAQKFSLYGLLSLGENLDFFASVYGLAGARKRDRIAWALKEFELGGHLHSPASQLAGGHKQRLAMACALLHEPEILFLDEPTSGADPLARRDFWRRITLLSRQGVTVIITTHFMAEAEYCDRVAILDSGRILAQGTPAEIRQRGAGEAPTMEDAFVAIVEQAREANGAEAAA